MDFLGSDLAPRLVSSSRTQQCRGGLGRSDARLLGPVEDICHSVRSTQEKTSAEHATAACYAPCRCLRTYQWRPYTCWGTLQRGGDVTTPLPPGLASGVPCRSEERPDPSGTTSRNPWEHRLDPFPASGPQLRPRSPDVRPPDFARDRHRNFAQS